MKQSKTTRTLKKQITMLKKRVGLLQQSAVAAWQEKIHYELKNLEGVRDLLNDVDRLRCEREDFRRIALEVPKLKRKSSQLQRELSRALKKVTL